MIKSIVFDLDDTLYMEEDFVKSGFCEVSKFIEQNYQIPWEDIYHDLFDLYLTNSKNVFDRFMQLENYKNFPFNVENLINLYRYHIPKIHIAEDVINCLSMLRTKYHIGIITDGDSVTQHNKIGALGLSELVDSYIVTSDLGIDLGKPNPEAFRILANRFNCQLNEMIYVGDNPKKDFYIKNFEPVITVRLQSHGIYSSEKYFGDISEDYRINSICDIVNMLDI